MAGTEPDLVLRFVEDVLANLTVDQNDPADRFVPIYLGREEIESVDLDRRFTLALSSGPDFSGSSSCRERLQVEVVFRYYTARDSRSRMVRDVRTIRKTLRKLKTASTTGLASEVAAVQQYLGNCTIEAVEYDYSSVLGLTLVTFLLVVEYHVDTTTV